MNKFKVGDMLTWTYNGDTRCDKILTVDNEKANGGMTYGVDFREGFYWVCDQHILTSLDEFKVGDILEYYGDEVQVVCILDVDLNVEDKERYGVITVDSRVAFFANKASLKPLKKHQYKFNVGDKVIVGANPPYIPMKSIILRQRLYMDKSQYLVYYVDDYMVSTAWWYDEDIVLDK